MRREERHHLKENPLAALVAQVQDFVRESGRTITVAGILVLVMLLALGAYYFFQQQQQERAGGLLAEAMTVLDSAVILPPVTEDQGEAEESATSDPPWEQPANSFPTEEARLEAAVPKLLAVAEAYPSAGPGLTARYEAAAALIVLGRTDEADTQYFRVIELAGDHIYGRMARLGLAESHIVNGNYDGAVALLEPETGTTDSAVPVDAVLMRLGRAYELSGQHADAMAAYTRVIEEFPLSVYRQEAQRAVETLGRPG